MAQRIDSETGAETGATLAINLYDLAYRPASHYFAHANSSALLQAIQPVIEYFIKKVLSEWDAQHTNKLPSGVRTGNAPEA
ncbi:hypothetical protein ABZU32_28900 [Sphaerisporangium sp. NPDC005288]|uniref:hypothetical protein n=1 Tax=Sphaerisporangium sp. NPDC005288 TaxID=3155114 RepID=UPI0033ABCCE8